MAGRHQAVQQAVIAHVVLETRAPVGKAELALAELLGRNRADLGPALVRAIDGIATDVGAIHATEWAAIGHRADLLQQGVVATMSQHTLQQEAGHLRLRVDVADVKVRTAHESRLEAGRAEARGKVPALARQAQRPVAANAVTRLLLLG